MSYRQLVMRRASGDEYGIDPIHIERQGTLRRMNPSRIERKGKNESIPSKLNARLSDKPPFGGEP